MSQAYIDFFLKSQSSIVQFETIELSHPNFSKVFYVVRNNIDGLTATLETLTEVKFEYYPLQFSYGSQNDDLDFSLEITFGDVGEVLPTELDRVMQADGFSTKPMFKYRTYRSDDLTKPMLGPFKLEIAEISFTKTGATFVARSPVLSTNKTGEIYTVQRFPMLASLL